MICSDTIIYMRFHIITLFKDSISSYIEHSILKRAIEDGKISVQFYDPKDYSEEHLRVDAKPYGGGPGMVIRALPVIRAIEVAKGRKKKVKIIFLSPQGMQFNNEYAEQIVEQHTDVIIVSGRYEGIDARIKEVFSMDDVSIGPFVLTGGELPAMMIVDVISRRIPGVLGNLDSLEEDRNASAQVYTRPAEFVWKRKRYAVPDVLLSGHHKHIEGWREERDMRKKK